VEMWKLEELSFAMEKLRCLEWSETVLKDWRTAESSVFVTIGQPLMSFPTRTGRCRRRGGPLTKNCLRLMRKIQVLKLPQNTSDGASPGQTHRMTPQKRNWWGLQKRLTQKRPKCSPPFNIFFTPRLGALLALWLQAKLTFSLVSFQDC
jgi:hypothetical protein